MQAKLEELVAMFAESVSAQAKAMSSGDPKTGNKHAKAYVTAFNDLTRMYGDAGREALTVLFDDDRIKVRTMAAAFLLRYAEKRARGVLEAAASERGLDAFAAAQALERWTSGEWNLDPT